MHTLRTPAQEAVEDIFFGQVVLVWARWFIIIAGTILILWTSNSVHELTKAILLILPLIGVNFFVHGRYLMEKPANKVLLISLSLVDLVLVTIIVLTWTEQTGLQSNFFIFYYPMVMAFAFVFRPSMTVGYTAVALISYVVICIVVEPSLLVNSVALENLIIRSITLASMGGLATTYWRIQRKQRREIMSQVGNLEMQLGQ
ncbi:MAG: hypothetical protein GY805_32455 [Chloroflexi bacterium]|nr:hypothetical protein [Chloroflexota bacterium]